MVDVAGVIRNGEKTSIAIVGDWSLVSTPYGDAYMAIGGGVRFKFLRTSRVSPLVQIIGGVLIYPDSAPVDSSLVFGGGGGIQVKLSNAIDAKYQLDLVISTQSGTYISRHTFAVVFKFGDR
jgi:hypothetical protein